MVDEGAEAGQEEGVRPVVRLRMGDLASLLFGIAFVYLVVAAFYTPEFASYALGGAIASGVLLLAYTVPRAMGWGRVPRRPRTLTYDGQMWR